MGPWVPNERNSSPGYRVRKSLFAVPERHPGARSVWCHTRDSIKKYALEVMNLYLTPLSSGYSPLTEGSSMCSEQRGRKRPSPNLPHPPLNVLINCVLWHSAQDPRDLIWKPLTKYALKQAKNPNIKMTSQSHTGKYLHQVLTQISPSHEATLTTPMTAAARCLTLGPPSCLLCSCNIYHSPLFCLFRLSMFASCSNSLTEVQAPQGQGSLLY